MPILRLQKFNYRILFIESRLNISDFLTRTADDKEPASKFPRFLENRIYNSKGEIMDWRALFSKEKCQEQEEYFVKNRRQTLSEAITQKSGPCTGSKSLFLITEKGAQEL